MGTGTEVAIYSAVASAITGAASAYVSKRNNDHRNAANRNAFIYNQTEDKREAESQLAQQTQLFGAQQEDARRAEQRDKKLEEARQEAVDEPLALVEDSAGRSEAVQQERADVLQSDLDTSLQSGQQEVGSGVQGNVSDVFTSAANDAKSRNVDRAKTNIDRNAIIGGVGDLQRRDITAITDAGQRANVLSAEAQRQKEIDAFLLSLAQNKARIDNTLAPNPVVEL